MNTGTDEAIVDADNEHLPLLMPRGDLEYQCEMAKVLFALESVNMCELSAFTRERILGSDTASASHIHLDPLSGIIVGEQNGELRVAYNPSHYDACGFLDAPKAPMPRTFKALRGMANQCTVRPNARERSYFQRDMVVDYTLAALKPSVKTDNLERLYKELSDASKRYIDLTKAIKQSKELSRAEANPNPDPNVAQQEQEERIAFSKTWDLAYDPNTKSEDAPSGHGPFAACLSGLGNQIEEAFSACESAKADISICSAAAMNRGEENMADMVLVAHDGKTSPIGSFFKHDGKPLLTGVDRMSAHEAIANSNKELIRLVYFSECDPRKLLRKDGIDLEEWMKARRDAQRTYNRVYEKALKHAGYEADETPPDDALLPEGFRAGLPTRYPIFFFLILDRITIRPFLSDIDEKSFEFSARLPQAQIALGEKESEMDVMREKAKEHAAVKKTKK